MFKKKNSNLLSEDQIKKLNQIAELAWHMRREEKDWTPVPDLGLRAHYRKELYKLLEEFYND